MYTAIRYSKHPDPPLVTLGDAITSFLRISDSTTEGMSVVSKHQVRTQIEHWKTPRPQQWHARNRRWANAASRTRWLSTTISYVLTGDY